MIRSTPATAVLGLLLALPLAACNAADAPDGGAASTSPRPTAVPTAEAPTAEEPTSTPSAPADDDPCALLTADEVRALAGEPMTESRVVEVGGIPACQHAGETRGVQVAQVPATVWVATIPQIVEELRGTGEVSAEDAARLDEISARLAAGEFDDVEACEVFGTMGEIGGAPPGQTRTVMYLPDDVAPRGVSAQSCVGGTYASVLLAGADIVAGEETDAAIEAALELVGGA